MFTGIIQARACIARIDRNAFGVRLTVDAGSWRPTEGRPPIVGDSICINGVCLTIAEMAGPRLVFDVVAETLAQTTLGERNEGDAVNLEPAVTPSQPMGGHFMQGHVDGVATVAAVRHDDRECRISMEPPGHLMKLIVPKGSVAIDGVSLTVASIDRDGFEVALIPTTLELTTLGERRTGDRVNLETDILSRTVAHYLHRFGQRGGEGSGGGEGVTMDLLREAGFAPDRDA